MCVRGIMADSRARGGAVTATPEPRRPCTAQRQPEQPANAAFGNVGRHGEGTQSLAVPMLFAAFLEGAPIMALE